MIGYYILNLPFREFRRGCSLGNLLSMGVPADLIRFHAAPYGGGYSSREEIRAAAIADGFRGFSSDMAISGRGSMAYMWGSLQIVRKIAGGKEAYGYYNQDDRLLVRPHSMLCRVVEMLARDSKELGYDFLFLQLIVNTNASLFHRPCLSAEFPGYISSGVGGLGDSGVVMSRAGACYILERFEERPCEHFCHLFYGLRPDVKGAYSTTESLYWIRMINTGWHGNRAYDHEADHQGGQDRVVIDTLDHETLDEVQDRISIKELNESMGIG